MAYSLTFKRLEVNYAASHVCAALTICTLTASDLPAEMPATPYAGQQTRTIKALSDDEIAALRNGEGMGMAKAAELNGYPGPIHVLALAAQLGLTESQHREVTAIFERMSAAAKLLGGELIARERPAASRRRLRPSESFRAACGRCIWPRICKSVPCSTPNRLSDINSSEATANRHRPNIITTDK
jgi:hypothetical protein